MISTVSRYRCALWFSVLMACVAGASFAQQSPRIALVIGNAAYKSSPLRNPENDAKDFAKSLKGFGFSVIEHNNLTIRQIGPMLREFRAKLVPGSVAVVFYAGHGVQIKGENYLPAVDADIQGEEDVPTQSLSTRQLMDVLAEAGTRMNLVFLDACRNNPFSRRFRSTTRGLSRENAPSGTLISFATRPGSEAADGEGRNGLYTSVLLQQLKLADQPIEQVLKRVVTGVRQASNGQQEPWIEGSIEGDFCFGECGGTTTTRRHPEDEAWDIAQKSNTQAAYQTYLSKFPSGRYSSAAEVALAGLKGAPSPGDKGGETTGRDSRTSDPPAKNPFAMNVWYSDDCDGKINNSFKLAVKWYSANGKLYMREYSLYNDLSYELNISQSTRGRETLFSSDNGGKTENIYEFEGDSVKLIQRTYDGKVSVQGGMWVHDKYVMPRMYQCAPGAFMVRQAEQFSLNSCNEMSADNLAVCFGGLPQPNSEGVYIGEIWRGKKHGWGIELQKNQTVVARYLEGQIVGGRTVFKSGKISGAFKDLPLELQIDFSRPKCGPLDKVKFMVADKSPCYVAEEFEGGFVLAEASNNYLNGAVLLLGPNYSSFYQIRNGILDGYARVSAPWFSGQMKSGAKNGPGMMQMSKRGAIYIGEFRDDKLNGKGRILGNMHFGPTEDLGNGMNAMTGDAYFENDAVKR